MSDRGYGLALRTRIVEAYEASEGSIRELAERFKVVPNTVQNWLKLKRATGGVEPRPHGGGAEPSLDERAQDRLRKWLEEQSDLTLAELVERLATHSLHTSIATVSRTLAKMEITRKKNVSCDRTRALGCSSGSRRLVDAGGVAPAGAAPVSR